MPLGETDDALKEDWGLAGGVTYRPEGKKFGIPIELGYIEFDMEDSFLDFVLDDGLGGSASADGARGEVMVWNLTGGLMWQTDTASRFDFYVDANAGIYWAEAEVRVPAGYAWLPPICGWYWCVPGGFVPVDEVQTESTTEFGANVGVGLAIALNNDSQIYVEAKYQWMNTDGDAAEWVPIQVGFRW
jgi:hypothetical protein